MTTFGTLSIWRGPPTDLAISDVPITCTAEVSSESRLSWRIASSQESGPQGPRRPRFSFFRFTFQTARGSWRSPLPGKPKSRRSPCIRELSDANSLFQWGASEARNRAVSGRRADGCIYASVLNVVNRKCPFLRGSRQYRAYHRQTARTAE